VFVSLLAVFVVAVLISLALTPLAIRAAWATGYIDHPGGTYKAHPTATALLGGVSILLASLLTWFAIESLRATPARGEALAMLGGAMVVVLLGLWDDRHGMTPLPKMTWQAAAIAVPMAAGIIPDLHLGPVGNVLVTLVAMIGLMNAVNFLDIMNGMVGGMAAIALATFGFMSAKHGAAGVAAAQFALAGATIGFLRYNFPSAKIFLGDAGSLLLGYSLGVSAILAFRGGPQGWAQLAPLFVLAYPAFNMVFIVTMRLREGRKIYVGDRGQSNLRLASVIQCPTRTVLVLWLSGVVLSASGLAVQSLNQAAPTLLLSALWLALFLAAGIRLSSVPIAASLPRRTKSLERPSPVRDVPLSSPTTSTGSSGS